MITIKTRDYSSTYIARIVGKNMSASCTMGPDRAAEAAAKKFFGDAPFQLFNHGNGTFTANRVGISNSITTVVFQDWGQDFLEFDLQDGVIVESRPCQTWVWLGRIVMNEQLDIGDQLKLDGDYTLKYPITEIKPQQPVKNKILLELISEEARQIVAAPLDQAKSGFFNKYSTNALRAALAYLVNHGVQAIKARLLRDHIIRRAEKYS